MNTAKEDIFLENLRAAKPSHSPSAEEWVKGERGQDVLERVLSSAEASAHSSGRPTSDAATARPAHSGPRRASGRITAGRAGWWGRPRLVVAGGGIVVVALVVSLAVLLAGRADDKGTVVDGSGTTVTNGGAAVAAGQVTKLAAIEDLMPLYRLITHESLDTIGSSSGSLPAIDLALKMGLLTRGELANGSAGRPMSQGEYAVLLARAFGPVLLRSGSPAQRIDPEATAEERAAIESLVTSGVIVSTDGDFDVRQTLTKETEIRLLTRVEESYGRLTGG
jgi:hypothetical protein